VTLFTPRRQAAGNVAGVGSVNFDRAAGFYDATRALPADAMAELTTVLSAELAGRQPCLEIGVGTGRIALPLRDQGIRLAGLDISEGMLRQLAANAGGGSPVPLLRADATRLPVAARTFGAVLAVHVMHLIQDWRVAADEALRVLRPGGVLVAGLQGQSRPQWAGERTGDGAGGVGAGEAAGEAAGGAGGVGAGDAAGQRADRAPWAGVLRESLRRRGMVRGLVGTRDPAEVAGYLAGRATARRLDPVPVRRTTTLAAALARIEAQTSSWTWEYTPDQLRAVAGDVRAWATRQDVPLDREYPVRWDLHWWAFDLPR
jgi:SAM-dependent methyltransferase